MRYLPVASQAPRRALIAGTLCLILLLAASLYMPQQMAGVRAADTTVRILPADSQLSPGETVTTEIRLENVANLLSIDLRLRFDPTIVQAVNSADPNQPATQVQVGSLIEGWNQHRNEVWNSSGYIDFDYFVSGGAPVSGTGPVAWITWRGVSAGTTNLTFQELDLSDGAAIAHSAVDGRIRVVADTPTPTPSHTPTYTPIPTHTPTWTLVPSHTPTPTSIPTHTATPTLTGTPLDTPTSTPTAIDTPTQTPSPTGMPSATLAPTPSDTPASEPAIRGRVLLQGRDDHSGTSLYVWPDTCPGFPSGTPLAITDEAGDFEIASPVGQPQCLQAFQPGYRTGQKESPRGELGTLALPQLPRGDVNQDSRIDTEDLWTITQCFQSPGEPVPDGCHDVARTHLVADLNDDEWVDVYDLAIASGSCNLGPISDWR